MGLTQKILVFTSVLVVALVLASLAFTTFQAEKLAQENIEKGLAEAKGIWKTFQDDRLNKLKLGVRLLGNAPPFRAAVETGDPPTILELFKDLNRRLGQTIMMITHNPEAAAEGHRSIEMRDGRVVSHGILPQLVTGAGT